MTLTDVIASMGATITRHRRTPGVWADGIHTPGSEVSTPITAVVQPANGRDLQRLPEGMRGETILRVDADAELRVADGEQPPDQVEIAGRRYQVEHVEDWSAYSGIWKALVRRAEA